LNYFNVFTLGGIDIGGDFEMVGKENVWFHNIWPWNSTLDKTNTTGKIQEYKDSQ
jgi:hypothetical protein